MNPQAKQDHNCYMIMKKYPRLVAHMICESLGYFYPTKAALALLHYKANEPFFCEWYSHMGQFQNEHHDLFDDKSVLAVGRDVVKYAFHNRHRHKGYMAEINDAKYLVKRYLENNTEPDLAGWF